MNRRACVYALATGAGLLFGPMTAEKALAGPFRASSSLQIAVAAQSASAANPTLDVTFKGGNVHSIELYLDGVLVNKQAISTRDGRGVISFSLDGATDGSHSVLVKAFDADGNCATATAQWKITASNEDVLARFTGVKQNAQIQGVFPLQISIDSSVHNPYVTFKIDNDFLAFTNYAPYSYNWDTTKADNGAHTIGVEVLDGESLRTVQTLSLSVNVNNPGGYTRIHTDKIPAPAPFKPNTPANDLTRIAAQAGQPNVRMEPLAANTLSHLGMKFAAPTLRTGQAPKSGSSGITRNNAHPAPRSNAPLNPLAPDFTAGSPLRSGIMALRPAELRAGTPTNLRPDAQTAVPTIGDVLDANLRPFTLRHTEVSPISRSAEPTAHHIGGNVAPVKSAVSRVRSMVPGTIGELSSPASLFRFEAPMTLAGDLSRVLVRARAAGNVAARPGFALNPASAIAANTMTQAIRPAMQAAKTMVHVVVAKTALKKRKMRMFAEFNKTPVNFDVPTRVEAGIPLTPFRQIFEFTGGSIDWNDATQTVHATSSLSDILFKIGGSSAQVNQKTVQMSRRATIDHGRAIVPISFIRDSMNVIVHYDEKTGHLLIESKPRETAK